MNRNTTNNENDLVYDPFMAQVLPPLLQKKMNRNYIGSELTYIYYDTILKRLESLENELVLY